MVDNDMLFKYYYLEPQPPNTTYTLGTLTGSMYGLVPKSAKEQKETEDHNLAVW